MPKIYLSATSENKYVKFNNFFDSYTSKIISMCLTQKQTDDIFNLCDKLTQAFRDIINSIVDDSKPKTLANVGNIFDHVQNQIKKYSSELLRRKTICATTNFVKPVEKALGFKWAQFQDANGKIIRKYQQTTYMHVPPLEQLKSLLESEEFSNMYMDYNLKNDHVCVENVYSGYCCGSNFKNNNLLMTQKNTLQLILYSDDYEPCDALKSRAGKHKKCAFYLQILNIKKQMRSKPKTINLLAMANTIDMKGDNTNINNVLEVIFSDLKLLEKTGIKLSNGETIKGCLVFACFDNLEAIIRLGLAASYSANYFCRFCTVSKAESKSLTEEDVEKIRDIATYNETCAQLAESDKLTLTET